MIKIGNRHFRFFAWATLALLFCWSVLAQEPSQPAAEKKANPATVDFSAFQKILSRYVTEHQKGNDYWTSFAYQEAYSDKEVQAWVTEQKKILESVSLEALNSKSIAVPFWMNTYNFLMIAKIFKDGFKDGKLKIKGVKSMGSLFSPYKAFTEKDFTVAGEKRSLDDVEKGILLGEEYKKKGWKDARIHFAVNCASVGCPPLLKTVYTPENYDGLLEENTRKAMKTHRHLHFKDGKLYVTSLFKWYMGDFEESAGTAQQFIASYLSDEELKKKVLATKKLRFIDYDWNLNSKENFK